MNSGNEEAPVNNLAAALRGAKLRQTKAPDSESTGSSSSGGSIGRGAGERPGLGGMMSMMDEMALTLARRRAKNKEPTSPPVRYEFTQITGNYNYILFEGRKSETFAEKSREFDWNQWPSGLRCRIS